jgi:hypothetical protein
MTAHEALWLMKVQLQKTEQNIQAIKVLEDIVKSVSRLRIDDEPTLEHLFGDVEYDLSKLTLVDEPTYTLDDDDIEYVWVNNYTLDEALDDEEPTYTLDEALFEVFGTEAEHIKNHMAKVGTKDLQELEPNMCARYDWAEDDEIVKFYDLCGDSNEDS